MDSQKPDDCAGCSRRELLTRLVHLGISVVALGSTTACPGGSTWGQDKGMGHLAAGFGGSLRIRTADVPVKSAVKIDIGEDSGYLVHLEDKSWLALDRSCTHKGTLVNFEVDSGEFVCPNHDSRFALDGAVLKKPAKESLGRWDVVVDGEFVEISVA